MAYAHGKLIITGDTSERYRLRKAAIDVSGNRWTPTHELDEKAYTKNHLSYDLRKLKAHGLLERVKNRFTYRLTEKGRNAASPTRPSTISR